MKLLSFTIIVILVLIGVGHWFLSKIASPRFEKIVVYESNKLPENNVIELHLDLKYIEPSWNVSVGDPILNTVVRAELVEVRIKNQSAVPLFFTTLGGGHEPIAPATEKLWFSGKLEGLWTGDSVISVNNFLGEDNTFLLSIKFLNPNIELQEPIKIIASWYDNM